MSYIGKITAGGSTHLVGSTLYGTCSTAAGTAEKVVECEDFDELMTGITVHVKFTNTNSNATPLLNVNGTGAKNIYRYGTTKPSTSASWSWYAGGIVSFTYDGSAWIMNDMIGNDNTYDREYINGAVKAETAITGGFLTCGTAAGYKNVAKGTSFDISYPVMYQGTAINANATRTDFYYSMPVNCTATNGGVSPAFTLYKAVYLYGILSGSMFLIDSDTIFTQTIPSSQNGKAYYYLGPAYSTTSIKLLPSHPIFGFVGGAFQQIPLTFGSSTTSFLRNDGTWAKPSYVTPASASPLMDGTAAIGTSEKYAKEDHVHPSDTSRVPTTRTINGKALSSDISLTASDIGAIPTSQKGAASGVAELDSNGKVPSSQLPEGSFSYSYDSTTETLTLPSF